MVKKKFTLKDNESRIKFDFDDMDEALDVLDGKYKPGKKKHGFF